MDFSLLPPLIVAAGIVLAGLALASNSNEAADKRVAAVAKSKESALKRRGAADPDAERRKKLMGGIRDLEAREKQLRRARLSIAARIEQAGLTMKEQMFWVGSAGLFGLGALIPLILGQPLWMTAGAAAIAGIGLPRWILGFMVGRRQKKFLAEFANAIEVIVRGVKSGLPLNECLKIIAREAPEPLSGEFRRVVDALAMGVPFDQALAKMFERMPLPEVSFFAIVLAIQQKAGGNLSEALNNLSVVLRSRKLMKEKVNALSSEAKASAGIIGALPIAVILGISVTSPAYIALLFEDPTGHMAIGVGLGMMTTGILVMRQMINFEI
jgi:tight adherence protein B